MKKQEFELEKAIKEWRKNLLKHPGIEPGYVEEMESHLRDKIHDLKISGKTDEEAFQQTVKSNFDDPEEIAEQFFQARKSTLTIPPWQNKSWIPTLLPNFLKVTFRNLQRKKAHSFINIFGLSIGLAACLLMIVYINFEMSFDQFHTKKDRIYRVNTVSVTENGAVQGRNVTNSWPVGLILAENYSEIEKVINLRSWPQYSIKHENQYFFENTLIADQSFLDVFDFGWVKGDRSSALSEPFQIVITREMEEKFFGGESSLGQTMVLQDSVQYIVSGVLENIPENSHIQFDLLISFKSWSIAREDYNTNAHWLDLNMRNYVLLKEDAEIDQVQQNIKDIYMAGAGDYFDGLGMRLEPKLEPLTDIYLYSFGNGLGPKSDINYLYLLGAIAVFILIIACINFMNLSTARSMERAKEVGLRKVVGSDRGMLIRQFLIESMITVIVATIIAVLLALWALPWFNNLTGNSFIYSDLLGLETAISLLLFIIVVGFLSGLYPAFMLSDFKPVQVLKNSFNTSARGAGLRKTLVVFQFTITCFLMICTLVVFQQLNYMQNTDLGFNKEQVLVMDARRAQTTSFSTVNNPQYETIKYELLQNQEVRSVSSSLAVPGRNGWRSILAYGEGQEVEERFSIEYLPVDFDYIDFYDLEIIAGRKFEEERGADINSGVIVNEAAVKRFGWNSPKDAIGKHVITINSLLNTPVIGVIKNYHHHGLQEEIQPLVMVVRPGMFQYYAVKYNSNETSNVLEHLRSTWQQFYPGYTFEYFFLDDDYGRQYEQETRLAKVYGTFAGFAIFVACLGLFGLTAFATSKRTKEIGIRKVLGASVSGIFVLVSKEFLILVALAFCLASPAAYWFMTNWLQDFAFRISIGTEVFLITATLVLLISIVTISYKSVRAAMLDPVNSLRSE